jgi:transposase
MSYVLDEPHKYFQSKVVLIRDNLQGHKGLQAKYEREHTDWFHFERLPTYSPELNVVGQCWNHVKNVCMDNFAVKNQRQIVTQVELVTKMINENKNPLPDFLKHKKIKP